MARKFDLINNLYDETVKEVTSPENWTKFLKTACYNYKLRFDEQLLIYAQKPEATAVLEIERWNRTFGRWVNRGAKGIAVFEKLDGSSQRLVHYFDISDTHDTPASRPVPLWRMRNEYADDVIDTLDSNFGTLDNKDTVEDAIISAAQNACEDNIPDYVSDLLVTVDDSFLEDLPQGAIDNMYRQLVTNSVAYMMMSRLGIDADEFFDPEDFRDIVNFNTRVTLNALGFATSDIAEMGLSEIARTVLSLQRENRIIAENQRADYTNVRNNERSFDNGRTDLHNAGRLSPARPDNARTAEGRVGSLRTDEEELPPQSPQDHLLQLSDERNAGTAPVGDRAESDPDGREPVQADVTAGRTDGEAQSGQYDGVGTQGEQPPQSRTGDRQNGSDIRLTEDEQVQETEPVSSIADDDRFISADTNFNVFDEEAGRSEYPFFGVDRVVNEIFATTPHLRASLEEIGKYYEAYTDLDRRTEYIRSIFNDDYTEIVLADDTRVGYKTYENGLLIWKGSYPNREGQRFLHWEDVAGHFDAMRMVDMLHSKVKPLPSMDGQLQLISESAERNNPAFSFTQELIDNTLAGGSGIAYGKMRIYEQYQKSLSRKENIAFLKKEYGWGGRSDAVPYTGVAEMHDGKGIMLSLGYGENAPQRILKWEYVEKRIGELIKLDRYLNPKEKEFYPTWLEQKEQRIAEQAAERERREILSRQPQPEKQYEYQYHLGDKVYIGASEYEITSFDDDRVMLFDSSFPLFNKEMTRAEFDEKIQENPMNDHLKVVVGETPAQPVVVQTTAIGVTSLVDEYFKLREQNAGKILVFQVGDFYEVMGDDAVKVAEALELTLTSRRNGNERVPMVGFPANHLEIYQNMLLDRGFDIAIATESRDETFTLVSDRKEEPVQSFPIGRIDYYNSDGTLDTSIEYTNPYNLRKAVIDDSPFETMSVYLYPDKDGNVIPHDFIDHLPQPLRSFEILDHSPILSAHDMLLENAKALINDFVNREYDRDDGADFSDLSNVEVAYTTTEDELHSIQASVNLVDFAIATQIDDKVVRTEQYDSLEDMIQNALKYLDYGDLVYVSDEELLPFYSEPEKLEEPGVAEEKPNADQLSQQVSAYQPVQEDTPGMRTVVVDLTPSERDGANDDLIGKRLTLDDRIFEIDKVNKFGDVSLRDLTFESDTGFPIVRIEKVEYVRRMLEQQAKKEVITPAWEKTPRTKAQTFDLHPDIPMADRHTFDLAHNEVEYAGKKERFNRNIEAIRVLKDCQSENRFATPDEQLILSKYVGWGGIPEAFDKNNSAWSDEYAQLKSILTEEEYRSAQDSTLTAFYTPPVVISSIYKAMEQMGFKEGNILEPSCGIGNFIGMLPQSMENSRVYGVEIDTISAGIAQQLYQRTSIAAQPFEEAEIPDSFFDAVVGNVPFGDLRVVDKRYDKHHFLIHDYFFAKSLDKLRPGGVMALVTSSGTMDKKNPAVRKYIAQRAELLGAIRLPNNTFKGNAGTEVVSDILILQKRDRIIDIEPDWVHLNTDANGYEMNSYFVDHPEMVLGEMKMVSGRFGETLTCEPYENVDLSELLSEAVTNIHGEITDYEQDEELEEEDKSIPADPSVRNFSYTVVDDVIYFRENSRMSPIDVSATAESRIKGLIQIRDSVRRLIEYQTENYPDEYIKAEQKILNELYDSFTKKYGLINSRANTSAFSQDSSYSLISALEVINDNGELERKADMFYKRTIKPNVPVTSVDTVSEALAVSIAEKAKIDMEYMSHLSGKTEQEIFEGLKGVIFLNPLYEYGGGASEKYLMADEYLSGNVREKLRIARNSAKLYPEDYNVNVEALERVQPKDLTASEISVRLGATWLPPEIVERFIYEILDTPYYKRGKIRLHYSPYNNEWNIEGKAQDKGNLRAYQKYGTARINAYKIIEDTLNLRDVRVFDYEEDANGNRKPVLNKKETAIAISKQELIKQEFQDWIWKSPDRREKLCKLYNEKFNSTRPREYDGSHITFNGMNPEIKLRTHQKNAVAHILYGGNTLLAHCVGAGKTYEMTAAAMESKRLGLCSKSLFVVPNHLTEQWAAEFLQLYPAANILVATKKDFEKKNRRRFCGRIATGDYDAIIIGHSQFEKIPMSIERQVELLQRQIDDVIKGIEELKRNHGDNFSVKQLTRTKKSLEAKLKKLNDQSRKDDVVNFEELGVDRLFIDESHYYKNLFLYTKMRNVGGIAQTEAQKSSDLFMKCQYLDELTGGRGTVFATGTPISNSMVELYTIQRYLQYGTLVRNDLQSFDAWASTFGETVSAIELTPEGTGYRQKTRFAKFYNLPELMAMFKEVADIQTADMLNLPVPKANYHNVAVKPSEIQQDMVKQLSERADDVRGKKVDPTKDNMLKITNDGRKLALDQRMINPMLPDFEGSKVNACVDNVYRIWSETADKRSAQLIFCDLSTPKADSEFSVYTDIRAKLIERGVPESEIRFIHEANTEAKKQELFSKTRKGEVRILLGSTQKMGAGTNVQDKLIALHDIDCPWRPSDLEQRSGRIIRQGNENPEVEIFRYVTEQTFDAYLYQLVEGKQKFSSQIMTSKSPVRSAEDIDETALSYAEIKMLATGNPYIKEKMDLDIQVQKLRLLKSNYLSEKYALEDKVIKYYPQEIKRLTGKIECLKADLELAKNNPKTKDDKFVGMKFDDKLVTDKEQVGLLLIAACKNKTQSEPTPLGEYRGFKTELSFDTFSREYKVTLKGKASHYVTLGTDIYGNITRMDNAIEGIAKQLEAAENELVSVKNQLTTAKEELEKPFSREDELKQKTARLNELNALLNVDKRENEFVGNEEPDEGEVPKKSRIRDDSR